MKRAAPHRWRVLRQNKCSALIPLASLTSLASMASLALGLSAPVARAADASALFAARVGDLQGLIDVRGRTVLPPDFSEVVVGDPLIMVRKAARTAYFDRQGQMVVAPQDAWTQPFSAGVVPAAARDAQGRTRWGYASPSGARAIAPAFDSAGPFVDGLAVVGVADAWGQTKYGAIDRSGRLVVKQDGRSVFIDREGQVMLQPQVDRAWPFAAGLAAIKVGPLNGYIDIRSKVVIEPQSSFARPFHQGLAYVGQGSTAGYINPQGQFVWRSDAP